MIYDGLQFDMQLLSSLGTAQLIPALGILQNICIQEYTTLQSIIMNLITLNVTRIIASSRDLILQI